MYSPDYVRQSVCWWKFII